MAMKNQVKPGYGRLGNFRFQILIWMIALLAVAGTPMRAADPTALELLQYVRLGQGAQHRILSGQLRVQDKVTPFQLVLNGNEIRYEFTKPDQTFVLKLEENTSRLDEITKDGTGRVTSARFAEPLRGTDVTCEDLALRFLYWQEAKIIGEDSIGPVKYYKIELHPDPGSGSQYGKVVAWVAKKYDGVLGRAECYSPDGKLAAVFRVISAQSLKDGTRFLKTMTIERMKDGKSSGKDPTELKILDEAK